MTALLLAITPIVLTALFAGQVAVTRTGRLRKDILANLDLLGRLPADCPNRAELETKNGELVGVLTRRQWRRYGPFTQAGFSLGVLAGLAGLAVAFAGFSALLATGVLPSKAASDPPTSRGLLVQRGVLPVLRRRPRRVRGLVRPAAAPGASGTGAATDRGRLDPHLAAVAAARRRRGCGLVGAVRA
jgi:hypothetical protein